jgi:hypothetical protein
MNANTPKRQASEQRPGRASLLFAFPALWRLGVHFPFRATWCLPIYWSRCTKSDLRRNLFGRNRVGWSKSKKSFCPPALLQPSRAAHRKLIGSNAMKIAVNGLTPLLQIFDMPTFAKEALTAFGVSQ